MKRAVNSKSEESILLNQLANDLNTIQTRQKEQNGLFQFAEILKNNEANNILDDIQSNKNSKDF